MDYNKFIARQNNTHKKANCGGTCMICKTKNINYGIEKGSFIYYCITCNNPITKDQISVK